MSVSDAAPLPRLGEVFFDVRGNSRSMRLSWYADTGVAVFSIWQAGMCTGTFRLPMADLSRMIEILERGPTPQGRRRPPVAAVRHQADRDDAGYVPDEDEIGGLESPQGPGGYPVPDSRSPGYPTSGYGTTEYGSADYGTSEHGTAGPAYPPEAYGPATAGYRGAGYGADGDAGYGPPGDYEASPFGQSEYQRADYADDDGSGWQRRHERDEYGPSEYERWAEPGRDDRGAGYETQRDIPAGSHRRDDPGYARERGARAFADTDASGYDEERFLPPYVAGGADPYPNDNRPPAGGRERGRGDPAYRADRRPDNASDHYLEPPEPQETYSYGADRRYR